MPLCPVLLDLTVPRWLVLPPLFLGGSTGIAAVLGWAISPGQALEVSAPVLLGFAAALALLSGGRVRWTRDWQRRGLRFAYPAALFGCALAFDRIRLPLLPALTFGAAALALLLLLIAGRQPRRDTC
ncbi:hypothetical protein ACL03H_10260 [Saccharopolyspora sp. MS10]|uniref:hypothetical protein n=1 Tax=Saccharopolyspora sp. MS10 TaxID=3385973 RepID=UPI0039A27759